MTITNTNYMVTIHQAPQAGSTTGPTVIAPMPDSFAFDAKAEYAAPFAQGVLGGGMAGNVARFFGLRLAVQAMTAKVWSGSSDTDLGLDLEFQTETDPMTDVIQPIVTLMKMCTPSISTSTGMLQSPGPSLDFADAFKLVGGAITQLTNSATADLVAGGGMSQATANNVNESVLNGANTVLSAIGIPALSASTNTGIGSSGGMGSAAYWKSLIKNQISIKIGNYAFFDSVVITDVQKTYSHELDALTGYPLSAKVRISFTPLFLLVQSDLDQIFGTSLQAPTVYNPSTSNANSATNQAMGVSNGYTSGGGGV